MSGRPAKPGGPFEARLTVRLPTDDARAWRAAATEAGLGVSDWLRNAVARASAVPGAATGRGARRRPAQAVDGRLLWLVSDLTSNVNQLARACNSSAARGEPILLVQVLGVLHQIQARSHELLPK